MSQTEMLAAAEAFLDFIEHASGPAKERLTKLAGLLDRLNYAYHGVEGMKFTYMAADEVERDFAMEYEAIGSRFPELGFYAESESTELSLKPTTGDAIDDIYDISAELRAVIWVWQNESPEVAANQFRTTFDAHWGRHSVRLRSHLHDVIALVNRDVSFHKPERMGSRPSEGKLRSIANEVQSMGNQFETVLPTDDSGFLGKLRRFLRGRRA